MVPRNTSIVERVVSLGHQLRSLKKQVIDAYFAEVKHRRIERGGRAVILG